MKKIALIASACALVAMPASAEGLLGNIFGQVQTNAKAAAFDAAVESQVPGAKVLTDNLTAEQKSQLFDFGLENAGAVADAGTVADVGAVVGGAGAGNAGLGAAAVGAATLLGGGVTQQQPVYQQVPITQPSVYDQQQVIYGAQPTYQTVPQQAPQPIYGEIQPTYQTVTPQPIYGQLVPETIVNPVPTYGVPVPAPAQPAGVSIGGVTVSPSAIQTIGDLVTGN